MKKSILMIGKGNLTGEIVKGGECGMKKDKRWIMLVFVGLLLASCGTAPDADKIDRAAVDESRMAADQAKILADAVMAEKAAPTEYMRAQDHYDQAEMADMDGDLDVAYEMYIEAAKAFQESVDVAENARMAALEVIRKSDEQITEIEAAANEAQRAAEEEAP